jgi:hypothetical protein
MAHKIKKGSLIKEVLEGVSSDYFGAVHKELKRALHEKAGIYALYKKNRLYYVGLASSLYGRIRWHQFDRHKGKWDNFSLFVIKDPKYLKDIETSVVRIAKPAGNKAKGRILHHGALARVLRRSIREKKKLLRSKKKQKDVEIKELNRDIKQIEAAVSIRRT